MAVLQIRIQANLPEHSLAQRLEEVLAFPDALEQSHIAEIPKAGQLGGHHGLTQGHAACKVKEKGVQEVVRRLVLPQSFQGIGRHRDLAPVAGQKAFNLVPSGDLPNERCKLINVNIHVPLQKKS